MTTISEAQMMAPGEPPGMIGEGFFSGGDGLGIYQCEAGWCSYVIPEADGGMGFGAISGGTAGAFRSDCATNRPCRFTWQPALLPPVEFGKHLGTPGYWPRFENSGSVLLK
jgi:hypothetical protein